MSIYAIISDSGVVTNTLIWDGVGDLFKGANIINIDDLNVGIGWIYKKGKFTPPPYPDNADYLL